MTVLFYIIIGLAVIFSILFFLYKKGKQVKDKELERGLKILQQANVKNSPKKQRYSGNGYRDFKKKPIYKKTEL